MKLDSSEEGKKPPQYRKGDPKPREEGKSKKTA